MCTPPEARTSERWPTFTCSFSGIIANLSCSFFSRHRTPPRLSNERPVYRRRDISYPRQLRRVIQTSLLNPHPIAQLPVEIMSYIFEIGSQQDISFPITVSHVCRDWRQIALHSPALWCRIILGPQERMWRERIRRAQACALEISLHASQTVTVARRHLDLNPYTVNRYMKVPAPYIQQWRSLSIHFSAYSPYLWKAALDNCALPAPRLEELFLVFRLNDDIQEFLLFAGYTPRLRRMTLDGIRLSCAPTLFANLTFLDYTHHGFTSGNQAVHDVISILSISSRIVELRILFPCGKAARLPSRPDAVTRHVYLPQLRHLSLRADGSDIPFELAHLVTLLSTPSLTTLRLIDLSRSHHSFLSLKSFFYVYSLPRTLRYICIAHGWYDPRMIHAMSESLPQLSRIHVKRSRTPDHVVYIPRPVRAFPSSGSTSWSFRHNSYKPYQIDNYNVQYFAGNKNRY